MNNLVLAGFMGTGKTTVGQQVATRWGWDFVDTDTVIVARAGRSISEIFASEGESIFRRMEAEVCQGVAAGREQVIATGGGALLNERTRAALAQTGLMVCLTCDIDEVIRRVGGDPARPLAADRARLERLWAERAPLYASLPHHVDTTHLTPQQAAQEVIRLWTQHT
jgi:shikimate kinase